MRAADGEVAALAPYSTPGTTLVLLGASGVGKSTVVNALAGSEQGLALAFSDVEELAPACRFADGAHVGKPGCAVQASLDAGDHQVQPGPPGPDLTLPPPPPR